MLTAGQIGVNPLDKAVWPPGVGPERDGNGLSVAVELETAAADGRHDTGIVHHAAGHASLAGTQHQVVVCGGGERISNDQQSHVTLRGAADDGVEALFDCLPVGDRHLPAVQLLERLGAAREDRGVRLQVHLVTAPHDLQTLHRDVTGVAQTQTDKVEHCDKLGEGFSHREVEMRTPEIGFTLRSEPMLIWPVDILYATVSFGE